MSITHETLIGDSEERDGKKYIFLTLNRRERKEKPGIDNQIPNIKRVFSNLAGEKTCTWCRQLEIWTVKIVFDRDYFWTPRHFRKIAGEKTHYIENKRVTYRIVVAYERSQCWIGVLVMVLLHNILEEPLIWWIIIHCILIIIIEQEHECVQGKYCIDTEHYSETSCCMNGWGKL